ncbi:nuclear transport factor 2 family protein [Streptomyces chartreusis]|uniref:nuclear transport factor 2 family protein n=1 Tax=Streptomyces chartreusis TaxID=1969 RepID=UPI003810D0DB
MTAQTETTKAHPNVDALREIYANLTRLGDYAADDIVLHTANREVMPEHGKIHGKEAAVAKERQLIAATGNTLVMDVQDIIANDYFGAVMGVLRAHQDGKALAMPFCGLWRFRDGRIVEHWENAYDIAALHESHAPATTQ